MPERDTQVYRDAAESKPHGHEDIATKRDVESHSTSVSEIDSATGSTLLTGRQLATVFVAFCMAFFLCALDQTILSTALPTIASRFNAVHELSWIASAYFLPQAAFMLFFGKVLAFAPAKAVFLVSVGIFEVGSLLCAVAPSVQVLIFGRAVAGLGSTGIWVSIMSIIARVTTLKQRPVLMGLFGAVFAVSSIIGPLIGGAFSDHVSWRWCFYINLPIGGVAVIGIVLWLPYLEPVEKDQSMLRSWLRLDWLGAFLNFGMVTFLLIALQWGGNEKPWNAPIVIAFLSLAAGCLLCFIAWEWRLKDRALLPFEILLQRNILGVTSASFFVFACFVIFTYYLPLLYQVRGHSATRSGIDILGFMMSGIIATVASGAIASLTGYAWPFLVVSPLLASVGFGLFFTVTASTAMNRLLGYQILVGVGLGCVTQLPVVVAQANFVDQEHLVPRATSLVTFLQLMGSSIGLAIAGAVFSGQLRVQLHTLAADLPQQLQDALLESIKVIFTLPDEQRDVAVQAYVAAIQRVLLIGVPAAALSSILALVIRFEKMRKTGQIAAAM